METVNRRCVECVPTTDHPRRFVYCPDHGKQCADYPVPRCRCGELITKDSGEYCTHCGKTLGEQ